MHLLIRLFVTAMLMAAAVVATAAESVPVIYSTDLFNPPDDPDDHVDLATLFCLPELDVRGIVLDLGQEQIKAPGTIPVGQMFELIGRKIPVANGLVNPLRYPADKALEQFAHSHAGVELMLRILRESKSPVTILTTGSLRDVAAAYNREPDLFKSKVGRIYVNAGNAGGGDLIWNPRLDPPAYLRIMQSGLPVYWAPEFNGSETLANIADGSLGTKQYQGYWKFRQGDIFDAAPKALQNFFLYALSGKTGKTPYSVDPIAYLSQPVDPALREEFYKQTRYMWSTASIYHAAGRGMYRKGDDWAALTAPADGYTLSAVFDFIPAAVTIDKDLRSTVTTGKHDVGLRVLHFNDPKSYQQAMTMSLKHLFEQFPLARVKSDR